MADNKEQDEEFAGFENLDEAYAGADEDNAGIAEDIDDAEFQDMNEDDLSDVFEDDSQDAAPAPKAKKKVNWFNIIVALVAVLVAGGLIAVKLAPQLLGGGNEMPAQQQAEAVNPNPATPQQAAQEAVAPAADTMGVPGVVPAPGGSMLDNPDALSKLSQGAAPAPVAPDQAKIDDPFAAALDNNKQAVNAVPVPSSADVPMPAPITTEMPAASAPAVPVMPVAAAPLQVATDTAASGALKKQVDQLSTRMDSIETKLDAAITAVSHAQTVQAAPADDARFDAIQSTLSRLESRLDDLSKRPVQAQPVRVVERAVVEDEGSAPAPAVKKAAKKSKAKKSTGGAYDEAYKASGNATPIGATGSATGSGGWTMRGAQPGQAIIGKNGDIRQVAVGDTVPGLGQITGIAPINGRWIVQGTSGRISQ